MPKITKSLTAFHGGLNSNASRRDVADNELTKATDVMVDELGKIRTMGKPVAHEAANVTCKLQAMDYLLLVMTELVLEYQYLRLLVLILVVAVIRQ